MYRYGDIHGEKKDRTLDELDAAITSTTLTAAKINSLVVREQAVLQAAVSRDTTVKYMLSRICDDCLSFPCLIPYTSTVVAASLCAVCKIKILTHGEALEQESPKKLEHELESHQVRDRNSARARRGNINDIVRAGSIEQRREREEREKGKMPTRTEMLRKAAKMVETATKNLTTAQVLLNKSNTQLVVLREEQKQLLTRLAGSKRSADDTCAICLGGVKTHLLLPCGHKCLCTSCATEYAAIATCPICRGRVEQIHRVYD